MLTRLVIALSVVFLVGAVYASTADAAITPPEPRVIQFKVFSEESCPTGVIKVIETPSPRQGDTAVFRTTIEGVVAPTTPLFTIPRWECTITATFEIVEVDPCACAAPASRVYATS